jgi:hypothetical protein
MDKRLEKGNHNNTYTLLGAYTKLYVNETPGIFSCHRKSKIYGRMDCPAAHREIAKGGYVKQRVFLQMSKQLLRLVSDVRCMPT